MDQTDKTDTLANATETTDNQPLTQAAEPISSPAEPAKADAKQDSTPISSEAGDKDANKKPSSLLDAVKSAVTKKADAASSTVGSDGKTAEDTEADPKALDDSAKDKPKSDAAEKLPFHNHPRWKEMITERDALKPKAEQFEKITSYMAANGLSNQEVIEGFQVMALMKTNPMEAHKRISEYKAKLDALVGEKLPEDLSKKVEEGFTDKETAQENARLRAEKALYEQRQQQASEAAVAERQRAIHSAVVNWEQKMKATDADWSAKQEFVTDQVKLMLAAEQPSTPEQALSLVERAYSITRERMSRFAPQRKPVTHVPSSTSSASAVTQPKTLLEAVRNGVMASR
jgi:hypothetical protein